MRRWLIASVLALVLIVLALPVAALYLAICSEQGLQLIARALPHRMGGASVEVTGVRGTVATGIHVDRLEITHERVHLLFEDIDARVALPPLLLQSLRVREATIRRMLIEVHPRTHPSSPTPVRFMPHWLEVRPDWLRIASGTLIVPNGHRFDATALEGSGVVRARVIRFFDAAMTMDALHASGHGVLRAGDPLGLDADTRFSVLPAGAPPWVIEASGRGDLRSLALTGRLSSPLQAQFVGNGNLLNGAWQGHAHVSSFDLSTFGAGNALGRVSGELALQGELLRFNAQGPLTPEGLHLGVFDALFQGSYADRAFTAQRIELTHRQSGAHATGRGTIAIVAHGPRLDLEGTWTQFRWPLVGKEIAVRSAAGEYSLQGVLPYAVHLSGDLTARGLAAVPVELSGTLSTRSLIAGDAKVSAFGGSAQLSGEVAWAPVPSWSARGAVSDLDVGALREDLPGRASFAFDVAGTRFNPTTDFTLQVRSLEGRLREQSARGSGTIRRRSGRWELDTVEAHLGRTSLALSGTLADAIDLRFDLQAEDLALLNAAAGGRLLASGHVRGTLRDPAVDAIASGSNVRYAGWQLASLAAKIDFDPRSSARSVVSVRAQNLSYGPRTLNELNVSLDGSAAQHLVTLAASAPGLKLAAEAQGGYADGAWRGKLQRLHLNGSEKLHLELESPAALLLSADAMRLERICLAGSPAQLCAEADWNARRWSASVAANDLPMRTLTAGLTPDVDYRGVIGITARAFAVTGEAVQGNASIKLVGAQLLHRIAAGRVQTTTLGTGTFDLNATPSELVADLMLDAGPIGALKGHATATRAGGTWHDMPLRGTLSAQTAQLDFLTTYFPQIDRAAGRVSAELACAGTLGAPLLSGTVKLTDGALDLYQINLAVRDAALQARLADNGVDFGGSARFGAGSAAAHGHLEWRAGLPYGDFKLTGENLRVADVPEAQLDASPDLDFRIDGQRIGVSGTVTIPQARIVPADLRNAVRASSDEVIVGESEERPEQRFQVVSAINLSLGEHVSIETSGLKGRLTGAINLRSGEEQLTRATGELNIVGGEYAAYGRRLDIDRGRLIFSNSPVGDPGIDIRAIKHFQDTVAGINVRGTLLQPRLSFFSEPPLPQQQIVSLILAGGTLSSSQVSNATGPAPTTARGGANSELIAQGGAILAQQLSSHFNIAEVGVESELNNDTSVVLGKYLSPRLYISYGISLTQSLQTVKVRYTLGDHWTVRTEFGQVGGADLVYTIDK